MATSPLPESVELRFAPYIGELRDFFITSHLPCGSPQDLPAVADRLSQPGAFAEDLSSLVRSIVLREGGAMPHAQLLEILAAAIGGPEIKQSPQGYQQSLQQLLAFVGGVMSRPWDVPSQPPAEVVPFPSETAVKNGPHKTRAFAPHETTRNAEGIPTNGGNAHASAIGAALAERRREPAAASDQATPIFNQAPSTAEPGGPLHHVNRLPLQLAAAAVVVLVLSGAFLWHRHQAEDIYHIQPVPAAAPSTQVQPPQPSTPSPVFETSVPAQRKVVQSSPGGSTQSRDRRNPPPKAAQASVPANSSKPPHPALLSHAEPVSADPGIRSPSYRNPDGSLVDEVSPGQHGQPPARLPPTSRFSVSSGVMAANLIFAPNPTYPALARITGVHGQVILQAVVAKDGTVSSTHVLRGPHLLRGAAQDAIRRWRFLPYRVDGEPVDVATIVTVDFHDPI